MSLTTLTIKPDGDTEMLLHKFPPDLGFLQDAVGGFIEQVPNFSRFEGKPAAMFCHEEGKLEGLPVNARATALWHDHLARFGIDDPQDILVGPVVIVYGDAEEMAKL